ncbi:MAG: hypothetical protein K0S18_2257 [Anaerocolumna sp.]|nr:hypothetical protein [Anaerocolumna sp.]
MDTTDKRVVTTNSSDAYTAFLSKRRENKVPVDAVGQAAAKTATATTESVIENLVYNTTSMIGIRSSLIKATR